MAKGYKCRTYYNVNPFIGACQHDTIATIPAPPFQIPARLPHIDFSVVQGLWIGSLLSNGRHKSIISDDLLFVGRTSDAGLGVPHISLPPTWMNLLTSLFGSSMCLFGSSSVLLACKNIIWGNDDCDIATTPFGPVPFSVNVACNDTYSIPTDLVVVWGSVYVGMSAGDFLAAFIDFMINLGTEALMEYGGKYLKQKGGKIMGKLFSSSGGDAAKQAGAKAAKKGFWDSVSEGFSAATTSLKKFAGAEPTDASLDYMRKATKAKAVLSSLADMAEDAGKNLDDDVAALIKQGQPGVFSKNFDSIVKNLDDEGYSAYASKYSKKLGDLDAIAKEGASEVADEITALKKLSIMTDWVAVDSVERTVLFNALKDLSDAAEKAALTDLACQVGMKVLKKSVTKILWKNTIRNGNLIHINFTVAGYDVDYDTGPSRRFAENWYVHDQLVGGVGWDLADIGLDDDGDYWDNAYVGDSDLGSSDASATGTVTSSDSTTAAEDDDDYWYTGGESDTSAAAVAGDEDDDDYWYQETTAST